jgi:hypothetical protein
MEDMKFRKNIGISINRLICSDGGSEIRSPNPGRVLPDIALGKYGITKT